MEKNIIPKFFLLFLIGLVVYGCYSVFEPFLVTLLVAVILVTIFYNPYLKLVKLFRGRKHLASLCMCIIISLLVIIPIVSFITYAGIRSIDGYQETRDFIENINFNFTFEGSYFEKYNILGLSGDTVKDTLIDVAKKVNNWMVGGAGKFLLSTTNFVISLILVVFTMYFFFIDGEDMLKRVMYLTPLPNKYDKEIFKKFKDVSYSTVMSTFVVAFIQGLVGAIGFMIVGLPALLAGIAIAFLSLLPYIGAAFIWLPAGIYLLIVGKIWQGVFMLIWGSVLVSTIDNVIRAYLVKGKVQVHPIFIIFSILGGIVLFGFWGIVFGPLIISLTVTVLHIYEIEYLQVLDK